MLSELYLLPIPGKRWLQKRGYLEKILTIFGKVDQNDSPRLRTKRNTMDFSKQHGNGTVYVCSCDRAVPRISHGTVIRHYY